MNKEITLYVVLIVISSCATKTPKRTILDYSDRVVSKPELFAEGTISTNDNNEFDISFTPDGKTAFFTRRIGNEKQKLWQSTFKKGNWTNPIQLPFSKDRDETPFFSPDGRTLYFGSSRPIEGRPTKGNFDMNIWQVERNGNKWSNPKPLSESINVVQVENEKWPSSNENFIFSIDNINFIYTTMLRGEKLIEVYTTTKKGDEFSQPQKVSGLFKSDKYWKYSAVLSPDGQYLLFNSYGAEGGVGGEDIFISKKTANGWSKAKSIGDLVNTKAEESSPRFSPDGKYFFFGRELRQNPEKDGIWSIYYMETKYLNFELLFNNQD